MWTIYDKNDNERKVEWLRGEATDNGTVVTSGTAMRSSKTWVKPELEYTGEWMGETFVTLTIHCAVPIDFEIGDYVVYRDEKFVMNYDPTVVKKARRGTYGEGFVYENVKFNSLGVELTDCRMLDYVLDDNKIHYSSLPKFSFFCNDVNDLADRLQANMDRYCAANDFDDEDYWIFVTPDYSRTIQRCSENTTREAIARELYREAYGTNGDQFADSEAKLNQNISVDNMSVWDACRFIKESCGYNFIVRGRAVVVGAIGHTTQEFGYGKGNGLYEIERTADSEQQIITKLYAYGSDKNLPLHYYANLNKVCYAVVNTAFSPYTIIDVPFGSTYFTTMVNLNGTIAASVQFTYNGQTYNAYVRDTSIMPTPLTESSILFSDHALPSFQGSEHIVFTSGINKDVWLHVEGSSSLKNNMSIDRLMLPKFPAMSLYDWVVTSVEQGGGGGVALSDPNNSDLIGKASWSDTSENEHIAFFSKDKDQPYIVSTNFVDLGIREGTKYFDGSDGTEEIYPTIKNSPNNVDIIAHAEVIEDNGLFADGDTPPTFHITLPDFGNEFNLKSLRTDETKIEVTDGYCGGRDFNVISVERNDNDGTWDCVCDRHQGTDLHLYFPYKHYDDSGWETMPYQLRGSDTPNYDGDHYVLTGIEMTSTYIEWGAEKLLEAALTFLESNDYTRYTYLPKIDEIYMARDYDRYGSGSCYWTLKEGDLFNFSDDDLGKRKPNGSRSFEASVYIDTLRIKEYGNGQIPTFEVTLRNDKLVGSIQRMQEQINSLATGGGGSGSGFGGGAATSSAVIATIQTEGAKYFLSKTKDDTANGLITFMQGLVSKAVSAFDAGITILGNALNRIIRHNDSITADGVGSDDAVLSERKALETLLRKDKAETLTYLLTMAGGAKTTSLESLSFETGDEGHGFSIKEIGGHYTLEIDDIIARRRFQVNVLDVKRTMFSQGRQVLTEANGTVDLVRPLDEDGNDMGVTIVAVNVSGNNYVTFAVNDTVIGETEGKTIDFTDAWAYKIYTLAEDDEKTVFDFWRVGDMAMCKELNVETREDGTSYQETDEDSSLYGETVANHQWHRLVIDHGTETLADGRKYNYVVVSNAHFNEGVPKKVNIEFMDDNMAEVQLLKTLSNASVGELCKVRVSGKYRVVIKRGTSSYTSFQAWSFDGTLANTIPMAMDDYVQYGSVLFTERQGVTSLSQDAKGGVLSHIKNIGSTIDPMPSGQPTDAEIKEASTSQFTSGDKTINLGDNVVIKADSFYMSTRTSSGTVYKSLTTYMGEWVSGTSVAYENQEWSYNGSKWVCKVGSTMENPPSTPSGTSPYWELSVAKGDTGAGAPGQDALIVTTDPSTLIIEQGLASGSGGHYQRDDDGVYYILGVTKVAVGQIRMFKGNTEVTNFNVVLDDYQGQQGVHSSSNLVPTLNGKTLSVTLASPNENDGTKEGEVYLKVSGGGLSQDVHMTVKVYINRVGTYVSQTVGDTTIEIRNRTATVCDDNGNPIEVVWLSTFERSAQGWDSSITELQDGLVAANSSIQQTADSITANVNSITTGKLYELLYPQTTTTYNYTIVSTKVNLSKGMWYTLSANGTCVGGAEIYITLHRNNYDFHSITLSSANPNGSVYFIAQYDGEYTLTAKSAGSTGSGYRATLSSLLLEQDASLLSQSYLEMKSDHISLGVEGMSNGNILEETDWRGKEITYSSFNDRGEWNASTTYNFLDKVTWWLENDAWVLLRAVSVQDGADDPYHWSGSDNPWVLLSEYEAAIKLTKWTLSGFAWTVPTAYQRMTAIHLVKSGSNTTELLQNIESGKIVTGNIYTLSFYYRAADALHLFMQRLMDTSAVLTDKNNQTGVALVNGNAVALDATDAATGVTLQGNPILPSSNNWKFISITFMANSVTSRQFSVQAARSGTSGDVTMLKLEAGSIATPWTELTKDTLKRSGIDIDAEKIVATTDNFEVHNSDGDTTFSIDVDGNIQGSGDAKFAGTVDAKILYTTFGEYGITPTQVNNGYVDYTALPYPLPQRLVLQTGIYTYTGSSFTMPSVNVHMPPASSYKGFEIEIFFLGRYKETISSTVNYIPEIFITPDSGHFCDLFRNNTVTAVKQSASASEESLKRTCKVRLLSVEVQTNAWSWMVIEATRGYCEYEQ